MTGVFTVREVHGPEMLEDTAGWIKLLSWDKRHVIDGNKIVKYGGGDFTLL
jgi:hypothetical protein